MDFKSFFKPTIAKILIFLLFGGLNYFIISITIILDATILIGFPLGFYPVGSTYIEANEPMPNIPTFSYLNFIIDIIFWYVMACAIVFVFNILKKGVNRYFFSTHKRI